MLTRGKIYKHNSNGNTYMCLMSEDFSDGTTARLMCMEGHHWTILAHDVRIHEDETIDWWYSTNGYFADFGVN